MKGAASQDPSTDAFPCAIDTYFCDGFEPEVLAPELFEPELFDPELFEPDVFDWLDPLL